MQGTSAKEDQMEHYLRMRNLRRGKDPTKNIKVLELPERRRRAPTLSKNKLKAANTILEDRRRRLQASYMFYFFVFLHLNLIFFFVKFRRSKQNISEEPKSQFQEEQPVFQIRSSSDIFDDGMIMCVFLMFVCGINETLYYRFCRVAALATGTDELVSFFGAESTGLATL